MRVLLASASPRRLELLRGLGLDPEVCPAGVDERPLPGEAPAALVVRLALAKARAAAGAERGPALVVAADTEVSIDGRVLGKPAGPAACEAMLGELSGRAHEVLTGVALIDLPSRSEVHGVCRSEVVFAEMDAAERAWYASTGEGLDKAGGYAVQGRAALFIRELHGSWSNVVGLPLELVYRLARQLGHDLKRS